MERRFLDRNALARKGPRKAPYERVLIVCEGAKTEPLYFRAMSQDFRLANVEVTGGGGSAPQSVVEYAIRKFEADPTYDQVWCVFDRDTHPSFHDALDRVRSHKLTRRANGRKIGSARFEAAPSIPCFEFWLLLHFQLTTAPLRRYADLEPLLRQQPGFRNYGKGNTGAYSATRDHLQAALRNARRANDAAVAAGTDNPTTRVPALVDTLLKLKETRDAR